MSREIPVYEIALLEYRLDTQPDYEDIGAKLDAKIVEHFAGLKIVFRGITVADHPGKTLEELVTIVRKLGHDRYDPEREGVDYPREIPFDLHVQTLTADGNSEVVQEGMHVMWGAVGDFYTGPPVDRNGPPIRLDLLMIYDAALLEQVPGYWGYRFLHPNDKLGALLGMIKIL